MEFVFVLLARAHAHGAEHFLIVVQVIVIIRAGTINRLIDNQSILKHQTDYQKQNLISINRKTYEYVNKALRLHKIAPKRVQNILRHLKFSLVGGVLACPC